MRHLLSHELVVRDTGTDVDPGDVDDLVDRSGPAGRPWVMVNMVASLDGATAVMGASGPSEDRPTSGSSPPSAAWPT
ncbi:MAG: hypothetical protein WKF43_09585 [Acidimicrobiales bacterium]